MAASFGREGMTANGPEECPNADNIDAPPDFLAEAFERVGGVDLGPVFLREGRAGIRRNARTDGAPRLIVFLAGIHQVGNGREPFAQMLANTAPLRASGFLRLLHKDRYHQRGDGGAVRLADPAGETHASSAPGIFSGEC